MIQAQVSQKIQMEAEKAKGRSVRTSGGNEIGRPAPGMPHTPENDEDTEHEPCKAREPEDDRTAPRKARASEDNEDSEPAPRKARASEDDESGHILLGEFVPYEKPAPRKVRGPENSENNRPALHRRHWFWESDEVDDNEPAPRRARDSGDDEDTEPAPCKARASEDDESGHILLGEFVPYEKPAPRKARGPENSENNRPALHRRHVAWELDSGEDDVATEPDKSCSHKDDEDDRPAPPRSRCTDDNEE